MVSKFWIFISFFFLFHFNVISQTSFIKENFSKNILLFNIHQLNYIENRIDKENFLKSRVNRRRFDNSYFITPQGMEMDISIVKYDSVIYPIEGFELFTVIKDRYKYIKGEVLYLKGWNYLNNDKFYLVAYKESSNKILFISGNFFKDRISRDFDLDFDKPSSFYPYIKLKCFQYQIDDICFYKKDGKNLKFRCKSSYYSKYFIVSISRKNKELLNIELAPAPASVPQDTCGNINKNSNMEVNNAHKIDIECQKISLIQTIIIGEKNDSSNIEKSDYEVICNALNNAEYVFLKFKPTHKLIITFENGDIKEILFRDRLIKLNGVAYELNTPLVPASVPQDPH